MQKFEYDWSYIRRLTLVPVASALVALLAMVAAIVLQARQAELYEQFSTSQSVVQTDYDALVFRRRIVERYHERYQQFSALGFVGTENRLDWIETLRLTSGSLTLPRVSYVIEPQLTAITPVESIVASDDIRIHVSKLELELSLVHELDLLHFVDALQQNAPGLISVDQCDLQWQSDAETKLATVANILAACSIEIFSIITSDVSTGVSS